MKTLKSGIELYDSIPTTLRLRYSNRSQLQKGSTYTVLGVGKIPLRNGGSYDAVVMENNGIETYVSIPTFLGIVFRKEDNAWTRNLINNGGINTVDKLETLIDKKIKVSDFITEEITNFSGNNVEREFPVWEIL